MTLPSPILVDQSGDQLGMDTEVERRTVGEVEELSKEVAVLCRDLTSHQLYGWWFLICE